MYRRLPDQLVRRYRGCVRFSTYINSRELTGLRRVHRARSDQGLRSYLRCGLVDPRHLGLRDDRALPLLALAFLLIVAFSSPRRPSRAPTGTPLSRMSSRTRSATQIPLRSQGETGSAHRVYPTLTRVSLCKAAIKKLLIKDEHKRLKMYDNKRLGSSSGASEVKQLKWFANVNWGLLRHMTPPVCLPSTASVSRIAYAS